jgi:hypothetical protein
MMSGCPFRANFFASEFFCDLHKTGVICRRYHARSPMISPMANATLHAVIWQQGYFDHRLREDELGQQLSAKLNYIRQNPVAAGLCAQPGDWPWIIDPYAA